MRCVQKTRSGAVCKNARCSETKYCNLHIPDCPICMNKLSPSGGEGDPIKTVCGHTFHAKCLDTWLGGDCHNQCPMCRAVLKKPTLKVSVCPTIIDRVTVAILRPILNDFFERGLLRSNYLEISLDTVSGDINATDQQSGEFIGTIPV